MGVARIFLGLAIVILGMVFFLNSTQILFLIDNKEQTLVLFEDINTTNTTVNLEFNFSSDYISKIYKISEGDKLYQNYLNVFIDEFKDNTTNETLSYVQLNSNLYIPVNKSYQISCMIIEDTLDEDYQTIEIEKSDDLVIDKITLEYRGADYEKREQYNTSVFLLSLLIIFFGILLGLYPV